MRTIFKYSFGVTNPKATFALQAGATPRRIAMQDRCVCIWVELDSDDRIKNRTFQVVGTGQEIPKNWHYVGTCDDGPFVWHVGELLG
jgi:hypothetical protein